MSALRLHAAAWLEASLGNRFIAQALLLALVLVLPVGLGSYAAIQGLLTNKLEAELANLASSRGLPLQARLDRYADEIGATAQRSLVKNALADTEGRDAYLQPFLREYREASPGLRMIAVTDFAGQPMAQAASADWRDGADGGALQTVLHQGRALAWVRRDGDANRLVLAAPVEYPPTGTIEGALLAEIDLDGLFVQHLQPLEPQYGARLVDAYGRVLAQRGAATEDAATIVRRPLPAGTLATGLTLELSVTRGYARRPILWLSAGFVLVSAAGAWFALHLAQAMAIRVTRPLRELAELAQDIASAGRLAQREVTVQGHDEIARLADGFNRMLSAVREAHEALESRVVERTQALAEAQGRMADILAAMREVVYSVPLTLDRFYYISPALSQITGRRDPRLLQDPRALFELVHPDDRETVAAGYAQARGGGAQDLTYRIMRGDGEVRWINDRCYVVTDGHGTPIRLDGLLSDVTSRVRAEQARAEAEAMLRLKDRALASSDSGILILANGRPEPRVAYANAAACEITGRCEDALLGAPWAALLADSPDEASATELTRAGAEQRTQRAELRLRRTDGRLRWVELALSPVREQRGAVSHVIAVINDIDERVRSAHNYRAVLDGLREVVFQTDLQGRWTYLNPAWTTTTGFSVEESLGTAFHRLVAPEDRRRVRAVLQASLRHSGDVCRQAMRYITKDGSSRWIEVHARCTCDETGALNGFAGTLLDITERHAAMENLRIHDRALQASSNGVVIADMTLPDEPIVYVNPAFCRITGYTADEVLGRNCRFLQGPESEQPAVVELREAIAGQREAAVVLRNYRKDGALFWNELSVSPVRDPDSGALTHYVGIQTDITGRREAERQMMESLFRLDTIFTLSPDGFVSFDGDYRVAYVNTAFERMTGLYAGVLTGLSLEDFDAALRNLCDPAHGAYPTLPALPGCGEAGLPGSPELLHLARPRARVLSRHLGLCHAQSLSLVVYFRDVTREFEVDRMKSEFLSTAAHELRTPMASIMGFSELLLRRKYDEGRTRDLLETIHRQSRRLTDLLNELLDLARIEARRGTDFHIVRLPLARLIEDTTGAFLMPGDARPITLELGGELPEVEGDAAKLQQALTNVLSNAYKYSPTGGEIKLEVLRHATETGLQVSDQGLGMSEEQLAHVFERFWRADTSGNIPGTGLGLCLVKEIIELHGGRVEVASRLGVGTAVTLWLPTVAMSETELAPAPAATAAQRTTGATP